MNLVGHISILITALKTEPYTIEESERAAGLGSYHQAKKRKMETVLPNGMKAAMDIEEVDTIKRAKLEDK